MKHLSVHSTDRTHGNTQIRTYCLALLIRGLQVTGVDGRSATELCVGAAESRALSILALTAVQGLAELRRKRRHTIEDPE